MRDIRDIIDDLASGEKELRTRTFLAPSISGGKVCARISGVVYEFTRKETSFEGWGIFRPVSTADAELVEEASLPLIDRYLRLFPSLQFRLVAPLRGKSWLAVPANLADARLRPGAAGPLPVHLVENGIPFQSIVAAWDGTGLWFDRPDRRADPLIAAKLQEALSAEKKPEELRIKGITPEDRIAYHILWSRTFLSRKEAARRRDEERLRNALEQAGGGLQSFREQGDEWLVEWHTPDGERHSSRISRNDLTVVGAGICLSGADHDFDLQSLVGVVENRPDWMR